MKTSEMMDMRKKSLSEKILEWRLRVKNKSFIESKCKEIENRSKEGDYFTRLQKSMLENSQNLGMEDVMKIITSESLERIVSKFSEDESFGSALYYNIRNAKHPYDSKISQLRAAAYKSNPSFCLFTIADIYRDNGEIEYAKRSYEFLNEIDPNYQNCAIRLGELFEATDDYENAVRMYARNELNEKLSSGYIDKNTSVSIAYVNMVKNAFASKNTEHLMGALTHQKNIADYLKHIVETIQIYQDGNNDLVCRQFNILGLYKYTIELLEKKSELSKKEYFYLGEALEDRWRDEKNKGSLALEKASLAVAYDCYKLSFPADIKPGYEDFRIYMLKRFGCVCRALGLVDEAKKAFKKIKEYSYVKIASKRKRISDLFRTLYLDNRIPRNTAYDKEITKEVVKRGLSFTYAQDMVMRRKHEQLIRLFENE